MEDQHLAQVRHVLLLRDASSDEELLEGRLLSDHVEFAGRIAEVCSERRLAVGRGGRMAMGVSVTVSVGMAVGVWMSRHCVILV
jgi:tetrahydromethanopterin S-methyltransferase subunit F